MEFIKLRVRNFLTIGDSGWIALAGRGLNVLQGTNEDDTSAESNGSGKSSIPDALAWACYGTTARGESGDAVVNHTAKKDCVVEVQIRDGESLYQIVRYRKHSEHKNAVHLRVYNTPASVMFEEGSTGAFTTTDLSKGTDRETQADIERVLGCSYEVFMAAIYAGQEQMPDLPAMTDKGLKLLIEQAAGVERLSAAYAVARQQLLDIEREIKTTADVFAVIERDIENVKTTRASTAAKHDEHEAGRETRYAAASAEVEGLKKRLMTLIAQIKEVDGVALLARRDAIKVEIASRDGLAKAADAFVRDQVSPVERALMNVEMECEQRQKELKRLDDAEVNIERELAKPCSECGKPHTPDEGDAMRARIAARREVVQQEIEEYATKLKRGQERHAALHAEAKELRAAIPDVSALAGELETINAAMLKVNALKSQARELKALIDEKNGALESEKVAPNPFADSLRLLEERMLALTSKRKTAQDSLSFLERRSYVKRDVVNVFGPAGVRAHILDTVTPFLNERTADYLSVLSDGHISAVWTTLTRTKGGDLKEKFTIDVENDKGARSFKGLSGGEKRKVRLATMLALQDLVASRASKPINLWIGDEIDDALDDSGLERLMTILESKARERGTVIVISHNSLTDWCDAVTTVTKKGGRSHVEGALCEG